MLHIVRAASGLGQTPGHGHVGCSLAPRCPDISVCRATPADKWLVGFRVCARGPIATWLYYVVDRADDAMEAKRIAISLAGDEIDASCLSGYDGMADTEIRLIHDDGIGPRRLLRCS
ncbi:hypothetical protein ABZ479_39580 [Streptomyces sp. NPDC005722]